VFIRRRATIAGLRLRFDPSGTGVVIVTQARSRTWIGNVHAFNRENGALLRLNCRYRSQFTADAQQRVIEHAELVRAFASEKWAPQRVTAVCLMGAILFVSGLSAALGTVSGALALSEITGSTPISLEAVLFLAGSALLLFTGTRGFQLALVALLPTLADDMTAYTNWPRQRVERRYEPARSRDDLEEDDDDY
jgi:hypothetical protein